MLGFGPTAGGPTAALPSKASATPPAEGFDITRIPASRRVTFEGGIRVVYFPGGIRVVTFPGGIRKVDF